MINLDAAECPRCGGETAKVSIHTHDGARELTVCLACGGLADAEVVEPWRVMATSATWR